MDNFIHEFKVTDQVCDELIKYFNNNQEYKSPGTIAGGKIDKEWKDSIDVLVYPDSNHPAVRQYFAELSLGLNEYYNKYEYLKMTAVHTLEPFNIQHYKPGGGFKKWHYERTQHYGKMISRVLTFMTYLNDVTDGGQTEWYYQNYQLRPMKGLSVIWPTEFTHTHRGVLSPTQEKYIVTGWFNII